jgi:hypothetical protein
VIRVRLIATTEFSCDGRSNICVQKDRAHEKRGAVQSRDTNVGDKRGVGGLRSCSVEIPWLIVCVIDIKGRVERPGGENPIPDVERLERLLSKALGRPEFGQALRDLLNGKRLWLDALKILIDPATNVDARRVKSRNIRLVEKPLGGLRWVGLVPARYTRVCPSYSLVLFLSAFLEASDLCIEVFESAVDECDLINRILRNTLKSIPSAEMNKQGGEPGFHEHTTQDADRHLLSGRAAGLYVLKKQTTVPECCGVIITMDGSACLMVDDGERAAAKCDIDFVEQPARAISKFRVRWLGHGADCKRILPPADGASRGQERSYAALMPKFRRAGRQYSRQVQQPLHPAPT